MKLHTTFFQVDLKHMHQEPGNNVVEVGIDLTEFYLSVEWDILDVPATKNVENYNPEMDETERDEADEAEDKLLTDITFILTMRRKTLFYTVNLIIPCVGISFLTVLVFYLPADSGEKVNIGSSILMKENVVQIEKEYNGFYFHLDILILKYYLL